jgi:hypothetical protein
MPKLTSRPCLGLCLALLATPAPAQVVSTGRPAADILLATALAEHRVFLTCSSLDPPTYAQVLANWQRDVTASAAILAANGIAAEAVTAFTEAARPEALLPAPGAPFEDIRRTCEANADWQARYFELNLTVLELKLPEAFE